MSSLDSAAQHSTWEDRQKHAETCSRARVIDEARTYDDIVVTDSAIIRNGIELHVANAVLINLNQIATVREL